MRLLLCLMLLLGTVAEAAPKKDPKKDDNARSQAEILYREAEAKYKLQKYEEALRLFESSYLLSKEPVLLFNIAQCQRQLNRLADAKKTYQTFLRDASVGPLRANAEDRLAELEAEIKRLASKGHIKISSTQNPIEIFFDGEPKGPAPLTLQEIEPGEHQLLIKKAGFVDLKQAITVEPSQTLDFKAPLLIPIVEEGVSRSKLLLISSAGLGGASALSLGGAAFFLFSASSLQNNLRADNSGDPNLDGVDLAEKTQSLETKEKGFKVLGIASAGFFAGAVICTGVRFVLNKKNSKKEAAKNSLASTEKNP